MPSSSHKKFLVTGGAGFISHSAPYSSDGGLFFWAKDESATNDVKDDKDGTSGNVEVSHDDPARRDQSRRCEFLTDCCGVRQEIRYC